MFHDIAWFDDLGNVEAQARGCSNLDVYAHTVAEPRPAMVATRGTPSAPFVGMSDFCQIHLGQVEGLDSRRYLALQRRYVYVHVVVQVESRIAAPQRTLKAHICRVV